MVFHVNDGDICADHLRNLAGITARGIHDGLGNDRAFFCDHFPVAAGLRVDGDDSVVARYLGAHLGGALCHGVAEPGGIRVTILWRPGCGDHAIGHQERIELFDFINPNDFHWEARIGPKAANISKPVKVRLAAGESQTAGCMPAHILAGFGLEGRVELIPVSIDFGKVVVAYKIRTLAGCMPS